jgi:hypothetical protein
MQIKSIILYNKKGEKRILDFNLGKVNIITGESKTGKTAIIDIVNYCLGSSECKISEGVIREVVEWFGILLHHEEEEIFVARQNPNSLNQSSTQNIYFANSDKVLLPEMSELKTNSDINTLKDLFTRKLFIAEFTNTPHSGTRPPLAVNFKHSRYYSYQPQDLIAQRNYLFYNQSDTFVALSIKDTLPYFLGAIREDSIKVEQEITIKKKELNRLERELKEYERVKKEGVNKIFELVDEAKQLNLISVDEFSEETPEAIGLLQKVLSWEESLEEIPQGENENLKKLIEEKTQLEKELGQKRDDLNAANSFVSQTTDYSSEVEQQKARLESISLIKETEASLHSCPLCSQDIENEIPSVIAINRSLEELSNNLTTTIAERPKLKEYIEKLTLEQEGLKQEIQIKFNGIKAIYLEQEEAEKQKNLNLRRGKIIGKISLFLEGYSQADNKSELAVKINTLKTEISSLEALISLDEKEERLNSILNQINNQMTKWSSQLDLEHQDAPIRFDIKKLTIFADTPTKSIPLSEMGSGANWVAYHLLIHLALHKHFIKAERPVPRFLIIDQPSQVYYPPDKDEQIEKITETSTDETAVNQIFEFIISVTKELAPDFQVIITDHAKLNNEEFKHCIIEEWRDGNKLIPLDWIES